MSNYTFSNQDAVPPGIIKPLIQLFTSWDDPNGDHSYLNGFHPDAVLYFGAATATGRDEIKKLRASQIDAEKGPIVDLEHTLEKVFVLAGSDTTSKGGQEVLMSGTIWYQIANGKRIDEHWASWAELAPDASGEYKVKTYRVYLDSLALTTAIVDMVNSNGVPPEG
jgi:hypothetical protein